MLSYAEIYLYRNTVYIAPYHQTQASFQVIGDTVHSTMLNDQDRIYMSLIAALEESKNSVIIQLPFKGKLGPIIELTLAKSWAAFAKRAKGAAASSDGNEITITPLKYEWPRKGFRFLTERSARFAQSDCGVVNYIVEILSEP